jgi:hypothetical protein
MHGVCAHACAVGQWTTAQLLCVADASWLALAELRPFQSLLLLLVLDSHELLLP